MTPRPLRVLIAPDKFKGTLSAAQVADALSSAAREKSASAVRLPLADGGEGTLEAFGGANRTSLVADPLGNPVNAPWRYEAELAVIEMARASGLTLVGGAERNDPMRATTRGTGELIAQALDAGARRIVVGVGGSATTDGGRGAVDVLSGRSRLSDVEVACDVQTLFLDAAERFAPQKGASDEQVVALRQRLEATAAEFAKRWHVDVRNLPGSGAAGGLAGGLAALGARLVPGFELVARHVGLDEALGRVDIAITGEGRVDTTSFQGKVVGGVLERCQARDIPVVVIAGSVSVDIEGAAVCVSLAERYGTEDAMTKTAWCLQDAAARVIDEMRSRY